MKPVDGQIPEYFVDSYICIVGTNHLDLNKGLLHKVMRGERWKYRGQGSFIVDYQAQTLADGCDSINCDKDAYNIHE